MNWNDVAFGAFIGGLCATAIAMRLMEWRRRRVIWTWPQHAAALALRVRNLERELALAQLRQ
jgi:hypothetical protein